MPTAPDAVLPAVTAGSPPSSPLSVLAGVSGGGAPTAPATVLGAVSGGGSPTAPGAVLAAPDATNYGVSITGTSGANGTLANVGDGNDDGYDTFNGSISQAYWSGGNWIIQAAGYSAFKTSSAATPVGLTGWTITVGTGQPTVAVATITAPAPVLGAVSGGGSPTAPAAVLGAVSGASPSAPSAVLGGYVVSTPSAPRPIIEPSSGWPGVITLDGDEIQFEGETLAFNV